MLKSYLTIVLRKLYREKFYAFICIASLSLGVACFLLISLYLHSELTYDHHHVKHENIYRLSTVMNNVEIAFTGYDNGPLLAKDNDQIIDFVRLRFMPPTVFVTDGGAAEWDTAYFADASIFDVFTINALYGDKESAFDDPYSIAISESFALRHFGDEVPIGQIVSTEDYDFHVSLVYEDLPENTQFRYDVLAPIGLVIPSVSTASDYILRFINGNATFLLVSDNFDPQEFAGIATRFFDTYMKTGFPPGDNAYQMQLQALDDIHYGREIFGDGSRGNVSNIYALSALCVFLLLIACVNYVNISTARATKRVQEIGVRKVLGANQKQLLFYFLGESSVFALVSVIMGSLITICVLEIGVIDSITGKSELLQTVYKPQFLFFVVSLWVLVSVIAGIYPALSLSRRPLMTSFKRVVVVRKKSLNFREILVLFQLSVSVSVIVIMLVMAGQVQYMEEEPLGFDRESRLVVRLQGAGLVESIPLISAQLMSHNDIISVTSAQRAPGLGLNVQIRDVETNEGTNLNRTMHSLTVGEGYLQSLGIELVSGREYSGEVAGNSPQPLMVNETFVREMQWEQPLGKRVGIGEVIGVFKDYHYQSLHEPIGALLLSPLRQDFSQLNPEQKERVSQELIIKVAGDGSESTRAFIREVIGQFTTRPDIEIRSLEEAWQGFYKEDINLTRFISIFAAISIAISLLGLIGMASFATEQRSREIAIRKVLGASTKEIISMLVSGTTALMCIAIVPASLLGYYVANQWLNRFSYRVEIGIAPFFYAFVAVGVITIVAVILQSYGTANSNPVENLRYE